MTLLEMRNKVLKLIEEYESSESSHKYTSDPDIEFKIDDAINTIQNELARIKKIPAYFEQTVTENQVLDLTTLTDFYQLKTIKNVSFSVLSDIHIKFLEEGTALIKYFKYPTQIKSDSSNSITLSLSVDALEIMPLGVAGLVLMSDPAQNYGNNYTQRYEAMKGQIDPRYNLGGVRISGGLTV